MITSLDVANYFLSLKNYGDLTNLKIQKMLYYAYGWHLAMYDRPIFDAEFEAWYSGPVIADLYKKFKKHKYRQVAISQDFNVDVIGDKASFLDEIYIKYGHYSVCELYGLINIRSTPWYVVYNDDSTNCVINDQLLKVYFTELMELSKASRDIDQFHAAKILSRDKALRETMYILSHPKDVEALAEALMRSCKGETIEFDWRNTNYLGA